MLARKSYKMLLKQKSPCKTPSKGLPSGRCFWLSRRICASEISCPANCH
ncbi:Uncharacterised protein [Vibrio cholerae]|nr:Uncharacterised protein [Vibrio cholerae]